MTRVQLLHLSHLLSHTTSRGTVEMMGDHLSIHPSALLSIWDAHCVHDWAKVDETMWKSPGKVWFIRLGTMLPYFKVTGAWKLANQNHFYMPVASIIVCPFGWRDTFPHDSPSSFTAIWISNLVYSVPVDPLGCLIILIFKVTKAKFLFHSVS